MKSGGAAKSYHKITMYVYLFFYFILFIYLKTTSMKKTNWKSVLLYIIRIVELVITGAAGGATSGWIG